MQTTQSDQVGFRSDETAQSNGFERKRPGLHLLIDSHEFVEVERVAGLPLQLVASYAYAAVRHARVSQIEDGLWFAEIAGFEGVWGEGSSPAMAEADLLASIPGWVELKLEAGDTVPSIDGFDLNLPLAG